MAHTLLIEAGTIAVALAAIISLVTWATVTVRKALAPLKDIKAASVASLRYSIARAHREYMAIGRIGRYAEFCINEMQDAYKKLGGNGTVDRFVKELNDLPKDV